MTTRELVANPKNRIHWMDNLRTIIIFLVALYHVGGVYEFGGQWGWFWIVDDPDTITWAGILNTVFDTFMMPTLFFISGYLATASLNNKTRWEFLKGKFKRLIVPWVIAVFTVIPLYKVIFLYSRNLPQEHWSTYFHFSKESITSQNWLWFLPVLFAFNIVYMLLSKTNLKMPKTSLSLVTIVSFLIGMAYSMIIGGFVGIRSWTKTPLIDFETERILMHFLIFFLGSLYYSRDVFAEKPQSNTLYTVASSVAWLPITVHIFARLYPFLYPESYAVTPLYRLIWWLSFHLSTLCLVYVMIESFWRYLDKSGGIWRELHRNSFGVYIIHVILIGVFGTLLLNVNLPALAKYPLLIISTYLVSNLVVSAYRSLVQTVKFSRSKSISHAVDAG